MINMNINKYIHIFFECGVYRFLKLIIRLCLINLCSCKDGFLVITEIMFYTKMNQRLFKI